MPNIGRKIYYDKMNGNIILNTGERQGSVLSTTVEQDITSYTALSGRIRSTFDVIELPYGAYSRDFSIATGYRVNPSTKKLEFTYPNPNVPAVDPVYEAPLSEKIEQLEATFMYDSMMKDLALEESNATQADLMYQLMLKGVL